VLRRLNAWVPRHSMDIRSAHGAEPKRWQRILAEFGSVVSAVKYAVALQVTMTERNADIEPDRRMPFRIGINLGDVIHDEVACKRDGVNIAARLEAIGDPGGICISSKLYEDIRGKIRFSYEDMVEQQLKNISQPVRTYRVRLPAEATTSPTETRRLLLPDKPSIAVLPFTNLSDEKEQEYFSDGITENIFTELSRFSELSTIARNSSLTYKSKAVDVRQFGRELGVRYVLQGSIRRAKDRVRVTAQLIDVTTGGHRWPQRDKLATRQTRNCSLMGRHAGRSEVQSPLPRRPIDRPP
jgi:adenylate cyclase